VGAFFNASDYLVDPAMKTGKLQVIDNAVVARILVNDRGLASGVQYFDRRTKEERRVRARVVVLGASCVDSTRILLNSTSSRYPNGIGNSSDVIGRRISGGQLASSQVRVRAPRGAPAAMSTIATPNNVILICSSMTSGILQQPGRGHQRPFSPDLAWPTPLP